MDSVLALVFIILLIVVAAVVYCQERASASLARRLARAAGSAPKAGGAEAVESPTPRTFWGTPDWRRVPSVYAILGSQEMAEQYLADLFRDMRRPLSARDLRHIYDTRVEVTAPDGLPMGRAMTLREVTEHAHAEYGGRIVRDALGRLRPVELVHGAGVGEFAGGLIDRIATKPAHYYFHTHPRGGGIPNLLPSHIDYQVMLENTHAFPSMQMVVSEFGVVKYGPQERHASLMRTLDRPVKRFFEFEQYYEVALLHTTAADAVRRPLSLNKYRELLERSGIDVDVRVTPFFIEEMSRLHGRDLSYDTIYDEDMLWPADVILGNPIGGAEMKALIDERRRRIEAYLAFRARESAPGE